MAPSPSAPVPGPLALVGSGEFLPQMVAVDRWLLQDRAPRVAIVPTASGEEGDASVDRWVQLGVDHYRAMGIEPVPVRVVNRSDADDERFVSLLEGVGLIYLSGGNPGYVARTLRDSVVGAAIAQAWRSGVALAGCSAGAMVLTDEVPDVRHPQRPIERALSIVDGVTVIPHFDRMHRWDPSFLERAVAQLGPGRHLVGIDEDTAMVGGPERWTVMGRQRVTVFAAGGGSQVFGAGDQLTIS